VGRTPLPFGDCALCPIFTLIAACCAHIGLVVSNAQPVIRSHSRLLNFNQDSPGRIIVLD
jgi:hypothetical protein